MPLGIRDCLLSFANSDDAAAWVVDQSPQGLVKGAPTWEIVVYEPGEPWVRVLVGFDTPEEAADSEVTPFPPQGSATSLVVRVSGGEAYVPRRDRAPGGAGRVWVGPVPFPVPDNG
jgi:hypothetical protein